MKIWNFEEFYNNTAIIDEYGKSLTYKDLEDKCKDIGKLIGNRCLMLILCKNTIGSVLAYVSSINNSIVPMLFNSNVEMGLLKDIIDIYQPSYIWIPEDAKNELIEYIDTEVCSFFDYCLIKLRFSMNYSLNDELCLLLTTSGSTGSPKFVRQSYVNVKHNAQSIVKYLKLDDSERPVTTLPMNYTYGLSIINSHLLVGATLLFTEKSIMQKEFWRFFKVNNATSFAGVPYTYEMLDKLRFERMTLPSLRYFTQAGGKLIPNLHKKFAEYAFENNKQFVVMYGQCEATARMGYLPAKMAVEKCGSMGIAIPGGKFSLIDVDGNIITEPMTAGELVYEGENVTMGYAECVNDLIKGDERNGILHTGDIAQFDEDGYYYIIGRSKRFLKIFGNRVNLDEVERLVKEKFENIDCACAGVDDHLYLFVTPKNSYCEDELKQFIVYKTKINHIAINVKVIAEIPKNDSGKILYKNFSEYYEN